MNRIKYRLQTGFSLVELALVLMIVGLLTAGAMSVLSSQREQVKYTETEQALTQTKQALLSFLVVNGFLPCPDVDGNGLESRTEAACEGVVGEVPYRVLGLREADVRDGFGNRLQYIVNAETIHLTALSNVNHSASYFSRGGALVSVPVFDLNTPPTASESGVGNYDVCASGGAACSAASQKQMEGMPLLLVAFNQRGKKACEERSAQELENCDEDAFFWQGGFEPLREQDGFFDDVVTGISAYEMKSHYLNSHPGAL